MDLMSNLLTSHKQCFSFNRLMQSCTGDATVFVLVFNTTANDFCYCVVCANSWDFLIEFANLFHVYSRFLDDAVVAPTEGKIMLVQAAGGIVAGATASCVTTPLDTIKTRLQVFSYSIFCCKFPVLGGKLLPCKYRRWIGSRLS